MRTTHLALEAAEILVAAYRNGKRRGGDIDWSDLDIAHEMARGAVLDDRKRTRRKTQQAARRRRMQELAAWLVDIADPGSGPYDLQFALAAACDLAVLVQKMNRTTPVETPAACSIPAAAVADADARLSRVRVLAALLVADGDETQDEAMEAACELATLVLGLDRNCCAGVLPTAWHCLTTPRPRRT